MVVSFNHFGTYKIPSCAKSENFSLNNLDLATICNFGMVECALVGSENYSYDLFYIDGNNF